MGKTAFIIFAHSNYQNIDDVNDLIDNIKFFSEDCDFFINHPKLKHEKIVTSSTPGLLNFSSFIFGPLVDIINFFTEDLINKFDHFCLVSANQYFINKIKFEDGVNYAQFLNTENWDSTYVGKDTDKEIIGFPLNQPYGRWDPKNLYEEYNIKTPMSANWECLTVTKEVMKLAKKNIKICLEYYPNFDLMNIFLPYMILLSGQKWEFPPHFGTYDPSNKQKNAILNYSQIDEKFEKGYFSLKRVNYNKDCNLKKYIKEKYMKK